MFSLLAGKGRQATQRFDVPRLPGLESSLEILVSPSQLRKLKNFAVAHGRPEASFRRLREDAGGGAHGDFLILRVGLAGGGADLRERFVLEPGLDGGVEKEGARVMTRDRPE